MDRGYELELMLTSNQKLPPLPTYGNTRAEGRLVLLFLHS